MDAGLKFLPLFVVPFVLGNIPVLDEDLRGIPVLFFSREIIAPFQDENALAGAGKFQRQRAAASRRFR